MLRYYLELVGNIIQRLFLFLSNYHHILTPDTSEIFNVRLMIGVSETCILEGVLLDAVDKFGYPAALVDLIEGVEFVFTLFYA